MLVYCMHFIGNCYTIYLYVTNPEELKNEIESEELENEIDSDTEEPENKIEMKEPENIIISEKKLSSEFNPQKVHGERLKVRNLFDKILKFYFLMKFFKF